MKKTTAHKTTKKTRPRARTPKAARPPMELQAVYMFADAGAGELADTFASIPARLLQLDPHTREEAAFFERLTDQFYAGGYSGDEGAAHDDVDHSRRVAYYMGIAMGWYLTAQLRAGAR